MNEMLGPLEFLRLGAHRMAVTVGVLFVYLVARHIPGIVAPTELDAGSRSILLGYSSLVQYAAYSWAVATALTTVLIVCGYNRPDKLEKVPYLGTTLTMLAAICVLLSFQFASTALVPLQSNGADMFAAILTCVLTMTAGSFFVVFLAQLIDRYGTGFGFWIFACEAILWDAPVAFSALWQDYLTSQASRAQAIGFLLAFIALTACALAVYRTSDRNWPTFTPGILLASLAAAYLPGFVFQTLLPLFLSESLIQQTGEFHTQWNYLVSLAVFCSLAAVLYWVHFPFLFLHCTAAGLYFGATMTLSALEIDWFAFSLSEMVVIGVMFAAGQRFYDDATLAKSTALVFRTP